MARSVSIIFAALLVATLPTMPSGAKPKKAELVKVTYESIGEPVKAKEPVAEITNLSWEELKDSGYVRTGWVTVGSVIRTCKFKKDRTEKCKDVKSVLDGKAEALALVLKHGGGLLLLDEETEQRNDTVLGKVCRHWRPNATNAVPDCASWDEAEVGYEVVRVRTGSVWSLRP